MNNAWRNAVFNSVMGKCAATDAKRNGSKIFFGKISASYRQDNIAGGFGQLADILKDSGWTSEGKKCQDDDPERLKMILEDSYKLQKTWFPGWPNCVYLNNELGENVISMTTLLIEMIRRKHIKEEIVLKWVRRRS